MQDRVASFTCPPEPYRVKRVWLWMRTHDLSNRGFDDQLHIERDIEASCSRMDTDCIKSVCDTT